MLRKCRIAQLKFRWELLIEFRFRPELKNAFRFIPTWNNLKSYKLAPISTQIFSAIKSNEQLLTDSQYNGKDYVDINYFIGPKFQRKRCRHNGI